jgi:predicted TIM-barrel fold metal-dependent hydrolase
MDLEGIDTAVNFGTTVFLSLPFLENRDLACAIAHAYNTWLDGYCKTDSRRLKGVALVAMQEPQEAVKELERCVKELGLSPSRPPLIPPVAISITPTSIRFTPKLRNSGFRFACTWVPADPAAAADRFDNAFFVHATTQPFEQMIGVMCIVGGGILELYPKLKVAFLEAGAGWVPYWMEPFGRSTTNTSSPPCR